MPGWPTVKIDRYRMFYSGNGPGMTFPADDAVAFRISLLPNSYRALYFPWIPGKSIW